MSTGATYRAWVRKNYAVRRGTLIIQLGGRCAQCGATSELEFDHPRGRDWEPSRLNRHQRMKRYEADAAAGQLQLLCRSCNGADNGRGEIQHD